MSEGNRTVGVTSPSMQAGGASPVHFAFPDALRGLASLWVVLFHLTIISNLPVVTDRGLVGLLWHTIFGYGGLGVAVFFVLSGFVIAHSLRHWLDGRVQLGNYLIRRVVRLSPPYWAAIVFAIVVHAMAARVNQEPFAPGGAPLTVARLVSHVFYLEGLVGHVYINDVFWTLTLEMQFYLVLGLFLAGLARLAARPAGAAGAVGTGPFTGAVAVLALASVAGSWSGLATQVTFVPLFYSFLLGAVAYWTWIRRVHPALLAGFLVLLAGSFAVRPNAFLATSILTALALQVAAYGNRLGTWLAAGPFQFLGRISYSLYLVHVPVLGAVVVAVLKVMGDGPAAVVAASVGGITASVVASSVFWWAIERPSTRWSAALKPSSAPRPRPASGPTLDLRSSAGDPEPALDPSPCSGQVPAGSQPARSGTWRRTR